MSEQYENELLILEHAADPVAVVASAQQSACEALAVMQSALGELDADVFDGEALMGTVLALESTRRSLDAANARVLGRLDASGVTETEAGLRTKQWKANRTHASGGSVARELKTAQTLQRFPGLAQALSDGLISVDHVSALARVCNDRVIDTLVEHEDAIVAFAKIHRFNVYATYLRRLVAIVDPDGQEPDCGDRDTASMGRDLQRHLHLSLELSGYDAAEIEGIINTETDRQYRAGVREHEATGAAVPSMAVLRARAVVELLRRGATADPNSTHRVPSVILPVTVDRDGTPTGVRTLDGHDLDAVTAAVLFCDAHLQPVVVDATGNPLTAGRATRFFTATQRAALVLRDGGCVFPGCEQPPRRCAAHHETEWARGGETNVDEGALLCPRHHGLLHRADPWTMEHRHTDDLPPELAVAHRVRATSARLEPATDVRIIRTPTGRLLLAQNATDHNGPAPPQRMPAG